WASTPVDPNAWRQPTAIDPGRYQVSARVSGRVAWTRSVDVLPATTTVVKVPALEPTDSAHGHLARTLFIVGGASLATSLALGGTAWYLERRSGSHCEIYNEVTVCDSDGVSLLHGAKLTADVGTGMGIISIAAAGAGVVAWLIIRSRGDA